MKVRRYEVPTFTVDVLSNGSTTYTSVLLLTRDLCAEKVEDVERKKVQSRENYSAFTGQKFIIISLVDNVACCIINSCVTKIQFK